MKVYIAGKITGDPHYRAKFAAAELGLKAFGHTVMNPAILPEGFTHQEYMRICLAMQDCCECTFFLPDWKDSEGARIEHENAIKTRQITYYATLEIITEAGRCVIEYADPNGTVEVCKETEEEAAREMLTRLEAAKTPHKYQAMRYIQRVIL
jgi:hypothetical protein